MIPFPKNKTKVITISIKGNEQAIIEHTILEKYFDDGYTITAFHTAEYFITFVLSKSVQITPQIPNPAVHF